MCWKRTIAGLAAVFAVALLVVPAEASTLSRLGANKKVCQLTGEADWLTGKPTNARTQSRYGLFGVDLGFPVESDSGVLYFLFGDTRPNGHPPGSVPTWPPDDAMGQTSRTAAPDEKTCLDLTLVGSGRTSFGHPTVTPAIQQGSFNVPTGGYFVGDRFYAFFLTDHCWRPDPFGPNPTTPLALPTAPPGGHCPETPDNNSLGASVLAHAKSSNPLAFTQVATPMPNGFVYVTAAISAPRMRGVDYRRLGYVPPIYVFGIARYRQSIPYLARAPQKTFGDVTTWSYYGGSNTSGPVWLTYAQWQSGRVGSEWSPPAGAELYADSPNAYSPSMDEHCVGEHSANYIGALQSWLLLYTCGPHQVEARTAPYPWGPWSPPTVLLSAEENPGLYCTLFWNKAGAGGCPGLVSQQGPLFSFGAFYAPFVMTRFTQTEAPPSGELGRQATIYWLLSTWDPYQVTVMRTRLNLAP
ncbi:MAG TPA: DUF4185 domain-containing protein [Caulobacteraceae bacterium]|nr:DUF4185 domain-containing protein [Caulobacteraceae bacterium]